MHEKCNTLTCMIAIDGRDGRGMHVVLDDNNVLRVVCEVVAADVGDTAFLGGICHSVKASHVTVLCTTESLGRENYRAKD